MGQKKLKLERKINREIEEKRSSEIKKGGEIYGFTKDGKYLICKNGRILTN